MRRLTKKQVVVMLMLAKRPPANMSEIAAKLGVNHRTTAEAHIAALMKRGLVDALPHRSHRRYVPSEKGRAWCRNYHKKRLRSRNKKLRDRDHFLWHYAMQGVSCHKLVRMLYMRRGWPHLKSGGGIASAVRRYAAANNLPLPKRFNRKDSHGSVRNPDGSLPLHTEPGQRPGEGD